MAATVTDKFKKYSDGSDAPNVARVASPRSAAGTTLACDDLTGWATDTAVNFATYELDTADEVVSGSITYWVGVVSGNNLTNVARVKGAADGGNAINDVVAQIPDSDRFDDLVDGLLVSLDQDGTLKAGAVDNAAALASNVVETAKIKDANVTTAKIADATVTSEKLGSTVAFAARESTTSIPNDTYTKLLWGVEEYDTGSDFATGTFTAPYDGVYHFDAAAMLENLGTDKLIFLALYKNGSLAYREKQVTAIATDDAAGSISKDILLDATDTVEVYLYHNKGSAVSVTDGFSHFSGHLVGRV